MERFGRVAEERAEAAALLAALAARHGHALAASATSQIAHYLELFGTWSARMNLTGAKSHAERIALVEDAFPVLPHLPARPFRLIDVGSGAGLPGLVLAILTNRVAVTLLEPQLKRHAFLTHAIRTLGLQSTTAIRSRLEDHRALGYDVAISRAVWPLAEWLERGSGLVAPGGLVIGLEGAEPAVLPASAQRFPYRGPSGPRAVVTLSR